MASIRTERTTEHLGHKNTSIELDELGIKAPARVYWNLNTPELYEEIARMRYLVGNGFRILFGYREEATAANWKLITAQADQRAGPIADGLLSRRK